jgi:hypothetical protein
MKKLRIYLLTLGSIVCGGNVNAQLCQNSADSVYGLASITGTNSGQIVGININNGGTTTIGSPASGSANANGLGFSQITGLFYFFNQCGAGTTEFVSYNPLNGSKVSLAIPSGPALPTASTGKIRSGTVTRDGAGYYTIFPGATTAMGYPSTNPAFYYYSIGANTWTLITQTFKDVSGNVVVPIKSLNSGDMAFDGNDNLWMLCSNSTQYALYRINAPLPTTAVASVKVDTIIPATANPISGVSFTGIAFNSTGTMYLSTGSGAGSGNNVLYRLSNVGATMDSITKLTNGYGDDLTSCIYPVGVLPLTWLNFNARYVGKNVQLSWTASEASGNVSGYAVQRSRNSRDWESVAYITASGGSSNAGYTYADENPPAGILYYRISQISATGKTSYSSIKAVNNFSANAIIAGPNPVSNQLYFYGMPTNTKLFARVYNTSGQLILSEAIGSSQQSLPVSQLSRGLYTLKLFSSENMGLPLTYQFIKQ